MRTMLRPLLLVLALLLGACSQTGGVSQGAGSPGADGPSAPASHPTASREGNPSPATGTRRHRGGGTRTSPWGATCTRAACRSGTRPTW